MELVSGAGDHDEEEEIDHRANGDFVLADADGFDENDIEACGLTEEHGFAAFAADSAKRAAGGRWADVGIRLADEVLHAGFIAENAAAGDAAAGVHGKHGDAVAHGAELATERFDERAFAGTGHTGDADPDGVSGHGQQACEKFLGHGFVGRVVAFHQGDGAREDAGVSGEDAMVVVIDGEFAAFGGLAVAHG